MELSEREQEILKLYRADKKRKRKKRITVIVLLLLLSIGGYGVYQYVQSMPTVPKEKTEEKIDTVKPNITLTTEKIEIFKGDKIEYEKYIKEAKDDKDGDLSKKVNFNKIDASEVGEYEVRYIVKDKAGNESSATLKVIVKEKEKPKEKPKEEVVEQPVQQAPQQGQQQTPPPQPQPAPPVTKYFMFTDGYTMDNVTSACQNELVASGRAGVCTPIQDASGVYTGMRLDLY